MPLTVLGHLLATMKGTTKELSPEVVTAVGGQGKPFDFRQLLDCKAARSVYRVDLHTPYTVRDMWLRGQRGAGVGHRVMGPLGTSRLWYLPPAVFEILGKKIFRMHPWCDVARASDTAVACPARQLFQSWVSICCCYRRRRRSPVPSAESLGEEVGEEGEGVQGTERRRWVLFRMPPPPWARSYLAWCRIQLV